MLRTAQLLPPHKGFRHCTSTPDVSPRRRRSVLPGPLAATRTGLTPAGNDELPTESDHVITQPLPNCRACPELRGFWGDDPWWTLVGGTDAFGVGVGVSLEGGDELGHLLVALDAAE